MLIAHKSYAVSIKLLIGFNRHGNVASKLNVYEHVPPMHAAIAYLQYGANFDRNLINLMIKLTVDNFAIGN